MTRHDPRPIFEIQHATIRRELMRQLHKQPAPQILEMHSIRLPDLAEQKTLQSRAPLAITRPHLREQPVTLAPATSAAVPNRRRPVRSITQPRRRARRELTRLQDDI